jgi:hypothetical protein
MTDRPSEPEPGPKVLTNDPVRITSSSARPRTTLRPHIGHVVGVRTEEQVIGPDARGIVTAMADRQTFGDRAEVKCPRDSMSPANAPVDRQMTVAACCAIARPDPATFALFDVGPEPRDRIVADALAVHRIAVPVPTLPMHGAPSMPEHRAVAVGDRT